MNNHKIKIRKTKYRTNRGMSMLEVIIAVSIFSVAAAVLLQGFVTSGRVNKKSGLYLEATTIAQNVMEEVKSKRFEEVALAFNYPIDDNEIRLQFLDSHKQEVEGGTLGVYEALPTRNDSGTEYKKVTLYDDKKFGNDTSKVTASVISEDQGKTYEFNPRETGTNASKYYFVLTNVENDNETFDVLVEMDGSVSSGYKSSVNTINADKKNDYMTPNILKMDKKTNALFILDEKKINEILSGMKDSFNSTAKDKWDRARPEKENYQDNDQNYNAAFQEWTNQEPVAIDEAELRSQMRMTLNLKVVKDGSGITSVENDVKFDASGYKKAGGSKYNIMKEICPCGGVDAQKGHDGCFCVQNLQGTFYNAGTDGELKDLFVFYSPNYASTSSSQPLDRITLDNTVNQEIQFYVVKQKSEKTPATSSQEMSYRVALEIKDAPAYYKKAQPNWYTNVNMFRSITKLRTNLNTNIATAARTDARQQLSNLVYVGVDLDNDALTKKMQSRLAETILDMNGLDAREATDRIYKMNVGVYKKGAAENGFPESELVASLEGAKEK